MSNFLGVIDAFSRFSKQQAIYFEASKLASSTNNYYGGVNGLGNVFKLNNTGNKYGLALTVGQINPTYQPDFALSYFSGGLNAIEYDTSYKILSTSIKLFAPKWSDNFYIGFKIETTAGSDGLQPVMAIAEDGFFNSVSGIFIYTNEDGDELYLNQTVETGWYKRIYISITAGTEYDVIWHTNGSDDANDWVVYLDGVETAFTVLSNDTFVGKFLFPATNPYYIGVGGFSESGDGFFVGYLGNIVAATINPRVDLIQHLLNR